MGILIFSPFYRQGNRGLEGFSHLFDQVSKEIAESRFEPKSAWLPLKHSVLSVAVQGERQFSLCSQKSETQRGYEIWQGPAAKDWDSWAQTPPGVLHLLLSPSCQCQLARQPWWPSPRVCIDRKGTAVSGENPRPPDGLEPLAEVIPVFTNPVPCLVLHHFKRKAQGNSSFCLAGKSKQPRCLCLTPASRKIIWLIR